MMSAGTRSSGVKDAERTVRTSAGFITVLIKLDPPTAEISGFIGSGVSIVPPEKASGSWVPVVVGETETIPLKPGLYKIHASIGTISSKETNVEVKAGQTEKLIFSFGRETE